MTHIMTEDGWKLLHRPTVNHNQPRDKTMLDELGLEPDSVADQYCNAIRDYLSGKHPSKDRLKFLMAARNITHW